MNKLFYIAVVLLFVVSAGAFAQTPPGGEKPSVATGDVVSANAGKIVLQTKDGDLDISYTEKTEFKKVAPDNPSLKAATSSTAAEIGAGDKLVISGFYATDKRSLAARTVYLMSKAAIAQKQAKDSEEWKTRGISGRVISVDQLTRQIKIEVRTLTGVSDTVLTPKDGVKFLRYAPNSVQYNEAKDSSILEVQPGDMLRAVGDKSADGASFAAEEVITGAFRTVAGTVKTIDAAKNEIVITDLQTKKDVTISLASASMLKRFPEEMARMLAMRQMGGMGQPGAAQGGLQGQPRPEGSRPGAAPGGQGQPRPEGMRPQGGEGAPGGQGRGGFGGQRNSGGLDEMLDRFPNITAADLKPGDMIAISCTKTNDVERLTAIKLLAGVEPFIRAAQAPTGSRRGGQTQSLSIPGLDGGDFPN